RARNFSLHRSKFCIVLCLLESLLNRVAAVFLSRSVSPLSSPAVAPNYREFKHLSRAAESTMTPPNLINGLPPAQGLYDPAHEHDACGIGFVASISGHKSHGIIKKGVQVLLNLAHRGACGCDPETGDGAGILIQIPHKFFARECEKLG